MQTVKVLAGVAGVVIIGVVAFVLSGIYNIAATAPHWPITLFVLKVARDRSIAAHSSGVQLPDLKNSKLVAHGVEHFHEMCRLCHGAPGYPRQEFAEGLYPSPPNPASVEVQEKSDAELYWIIENGVKMTGMPAFGSTHNRELITGILALVRQLSKLTPDEYDALMKSSGLHKGGGEMHHGSTGSVGNTASPDTK